MFYANNFIYVNTSGPNTFPWDTPSSTFGRSDTLSFKSDWKELKTESLYLSFCISINNLLQIILGPVAEK